MHQLVAVSKSVVQHRYSRWRQRWPPNFGKSILIQYSIHIDMNFNYITMQYIKQIQKLVVISLNQDGVQNGCRKSAFSRLNSGCAR